MLTRDEIKAAADRPFEIVNVPEWGGDVRIGTMSAADRDEYEQCILAGKEKSKDDRMANIRGHLICRCAQDENGNRLFTADDVGWLGDKGASAMSRLFDVALRLNRLRKQDQEELLGN